MSGTLRSTTTTTTKNPTTTTMNSTSPFTTSCSPFMPSHSSPLGSTPIITSAGTNTAPMVRSPLSTLPNGDNIRYNINNSKLYPGGNGGGGGGGGVSKHSRAFGGALTSSGGGPARPSPLGMASSSSSPSALRSSNNKNQVSRLPSPIPKGGAGGALSTSYRLQQQNGPTYATSGAPSWARAPSALSSPSFGGGGGGRRAGAMSQRSRQPSFAISPIREAPSPLSSPSPTMSSPRRQFTPAPTATAAPAFSPPLALFPSSPLARMSPSMAASTALSSSSPTRHPIMTMSTTTTPTQNHRRAPVTFNPFLDGTRSPESHPPLEAWLAAPVMEESGSGHEDKEEEEEKEDGEEGEGKYWGRSVGGGGKTVAALGSTAAAASPSPAPFRWSIDQMAHLLPTDIHVSPRNPQFRERGALTPQSRLRDECEQRDADRFFNRARIAPSPALASRVGSAAKSNSKHTPFRHATDNLGVPAPPRLNLGAAGVDAGVQTDISCPFDEDLLEHLLAQQKERAAGGPGPGPIVERDSETRPSSQTSGSRDDMANEKSKKASISTLSLSFAAMEDIENNEPGTQAAAVCTLEQALGLEEEEEQGEGNKEEGEAKQLIGEGVIVGQKTEKMQKNEEAGNEAVTIAVDTTVPEYVHSASTPPRSPGAFIVRSSPHLEPAHQYASRAVASTPIREQWGPAPSPPTTLSPTSQSSLLQPPVSMDTLQGLPSPITDSDKSTAAVEVSGYSGTAQVLQALRLDGSFDGGNAHDNDVINSDGNTSTAAFCTAAITAAITPASAPGPVPRTAVSEPILATTRSRITASTGAITPCPSSVSYLFDQRRPYSAGTITRARPPVDPSSGGGSNAGRAHSRTRGVRKNYQRSQCQQQPPGAYSPVPGGVRRPISGYARRLEAGPPAVHMGRRVFAPTTPPAPPAWLAPALNISQTSTRQ